VFAVTGITNKGKTSACNSDKKTLETAEESYQANTGNDYTTDQQDLVDAGFMHEATDNFTITVSGSGATSRYALHGVNNSATGGADCSFIV
jgi:hypothetical protein